jgi:Uma2 family endonuclease
MLTLPWRDPPLTKQEAIDLFMLTLLDNGEESSRSFGGDLWFWSASAFAHILRNHARRQQLPWYVASMLPIAYNPQNTPRKKVFAPDTFVAFAPDHARTIFDVEAEDGPFPPFVMEVVSSSNEERDHGENRRAYELFGVREYALFTPREGAPSSLEGYHRDPAGAFTPWRPDEQGRLWSDVLGLFLIVRGPLLQAQTPEGRILLTPEQANDAYLRAEEARTNEAEARLRAEAEIERLQCELERYRGGS